MHQYLNNLQETFYIPSSLASSPKVRIKPFLKWPGGKRWLARELVPIIASKIKNRYFEPFLGGGAVFFALQYKNAILSDINGDLINAYIQVRDHPDELIEGIKQLPITKEDYYRIRSEEPKYPLDQAIRFLYLNRLAFGGIYRLSLDGKFNVPYNGGNRTPETLWRDGLIHRASAALQGIEIIASDFQSIMDISTHGDVVYCDPTYITASSKNGFTRYNGNRFSWSDQQRLSKSAMDACNRGAFIIVSNGNFSELYDLYSPIEPKQLTRKSLVSPKSEARREIAELLFVLDPEKMG